MATPEQAPPTRVPLWLTISLCVIVFFGAAMVLRGRSSGREVPYINDQIQYEETLDVIEKDTAVVFAKFDADEELTKEDVEVLQGVQPKIQGLVNFASNHFGIYHLKAKVHFALGEYQDAVHACNRLYELGPSRGSDDVVGVVAETRYICSRSYLMLNRYDEAIAEAKAALAVFPDVPKYRFALASAYFQAGRDKDARDVIDRAVRDGWDSPQLRGIDAYLKKREEDEKKENQQVKTGEP